LETGADKTAGVSGFREQLRGRAQVQRLDVKEEGGVAWVMTAQWGKGTEWEEIGKKTDLPLFLVKTGKKISRRQGLLVCDS